MGTKACKRGGRTFFVELETFVDDGAGLFGGVEGAARSPTSILGAIELGLGRSAFVSAHDDAMSEHVHVALVQRKGLVEQVVAGSEEVDELAIEIEDGKYKDEMILHETEDALVVVDSVGRDEGDHDTEVGVGLDLSLAF